MTTAEPRPDPVLKAVGAWQPARVGASPPRPALFSLNMLVNTGEGRSYSGEEIMRLMKEAGFERLEVRSLPPPAHTSLVIDEKR